MNDDPEATGLSGPAPNGPRRRKHLGPLQDLLLKAAPLDQSGSASIYTLAAALRLNNFTIYKWIKNNKLSATRAREVVAVSEGRVCFEDFIDFLA